MGASLSIASDVLIMPPEMEALTDDERMEWIDRFKAIEERLIRMEAERESFLILVEEYKTTSETQAQHYHELLTQKLDSFIKNADCTHDDIEASVQALRRDFNKHTSDEDNERRYQHTEQKKTQRMLWAVVVSVALSLATWAFVEIDRLQEQVNNNHTHE